MLTYEVHPHPLFIPPNARFLIVGSFPGRANVSNGPNQWFYSAPRNQFWKILGAVYDRELGLVEERKALCREKGIAIGDVLLKVIRTKTSNSDSALQVVEHNVKALQEALQQHRFEKILFTSKFVEKEFRKLFPQVMQGETLPSPSPRYAKMSLQEKIHAYRKALEQNG